MLTSAIGPGLDPVGELASSTRANATPAPVVPTPPPPPPPVELADMLAKGVVIVISKPSQQMFVFTDGQLWGTSKVSTGRRGKTTPTGVFAILQKKVFHRSNLYSNAPMPFMQRLTWSGIAIHAGHLPGYPASHGCIRLPRSFAKSLFDLTHYSSTAVIVTDEPVSAEQDAMRVATNGNAVVPMDVRFRKERQVRLARAETAPLKRAEPSFVRAPIAPPRSASGQTIQLVAAPSHEAARAHWSDLVAAHPELARMQQTIIPAWVNSRRYYRLRASAPDAHATCGSLRQAGVACFAVT